MNFFLHFVKNFANMYFSVQSINRQKNKRRRTGDGLTKQIQAAKTRREKSEETKIDSPAKPPKFKWTSTYSDEYFKAIEDINDAYRKMLSIGEAKKVFRDQVCPMMTANTKEEFHRAKKTIQWRYHRYISTNKAVLKLRGDVYFIPDPRKYNGSPGHKLPTMREILAREKILQFEHDMENLNMFMCTGCKECDIESKPATTDLTYVCKACNKRKDPDYYINNNLHPVWYLVDDDNNYVLDENGKKVVQYHIPEELACLSMYEKLLIRRCANFVPSVHLKNGIFGLKGHCVTFPQDITEMCDELPQRKETLLTFVRNIGNKDTDAVFPISLRVNRLKVLNALKWLKKHNPFYRNIKIKEENLDWMNGADEVNMGTDGVVLKMKENPKSQLKETEDEHVSNVHSAHTNHKALHNDGNEDEWEDEDDVLPMRTVHANETIKVPSGRQAQQIKELIDIAHKTDQSSKIMNFPPIDHDSAIS